jgi:hypothetical protein
MKFLAVCFCVLISGTAAAQNWTAERKQKLRNMLESEYSIKTQKWLGDLNAQIKPGATPSERSMAAGALKLMLYNQAYGQYRCLTTSASWAEAEECNKRVGRDIAIYFRLATDHFSAVAGRSDQCEMQTRMFEAEIEFPPFPFLQGAQLYDIPRMVECLRK